MTERQAVIEGLLFLSADPVSTTDLADALDCDPEEVLEAIEALRDHYAEGRHGIVVKEVAGGYALATDPVVEPAARKLLAKPRTPPLSAAQAETLAIVAYLQPVSRPEIARIRGVNSESATQTLAERGLIEEAGRSQFGAVLYRTTELFLRLFGLGSLGDLPDPAQWDPTPEVTEQMRSRLLHAGEARAGLTPPPQLETAPDIGEPPSGGIG